MTNEHQNIIELPATKKEPEEPNPAIPRFMDKERLREIRLNADWRKLFITLGLKQDEKRSTENDWWALSPFTKETVPSFHINDKGWYCHSSGQGGGVIELVQKFYNLDCYRVGKWLLEHGISHLSTGDAQTPCDAIEMPDNRPIALPVESRSEEKKELSKNKPIRQNLIPSLTLQGEHPMFQERGISKETCDYLGGGYLEKSRGNMQGRIIFQVRGIQESANGLKPVILSHIGRATTKEQEETDGKWCHYAGFHKTLELYNLDKVLLDANAIEQIRQTGRVLIVEGCFDVAALVEAKIYNVVASFGAHLAENQLPRIKQIADTLGVKDFLVWYDRDKAGMEGQEKALALLREAGYQAHGFDWEREFESVVRGKVKIPPSLNDVGDFSADKLEWLRAKSVI